MLMRVGSVCQILRSVLLRPLLSPSVVAVMSPSDSSSVPVFDGRRSIPSGSFHTLRTCIVGVTVPLCLHPVSAIQRAAS